MTDLSNVFIQAFITIFVIVDPICMMPIFVALTRDSDAAHRRSMAVRGTLIATGALLVFALTGDALLRLFGITLAAFRIAGGLLMFSTAFEMVFEFRAKRRNRTVESAMSEHPKVVEDISVVPVAIPFLAGPGAITAVILLMTQQPGDIGHHGAVVAALLVVMGLSFLFLEISGRFAPYMGSTVTTVITRLLGVVLAALSVQFVIDGVRQAIAG